MAKILNLRPLARVPLSTLRTDAPGRVSLNPVSTSRLVFSFAAVASIKTPLATSASVMPPCFFFLATPLPLTLSS